MHGRPPVFSQPTFHFTFYENPHHTIYDIVQIHHMMDPIHHMMDRGVHHMMDSVHHMMDSVHHMMDGLHNIMDTFFRQIRYSSGF